MLAYDCRQWQLKGVAKLSERVNETWKHGLSFRFASPINKQGSRHRALH